MVIRLLLRLIIKIGITKRKFSNLHQNEYIHFNFVTIFQHSAFKSSPLTMSIQILIAYSGKLKKLIKSAIIKELKSTDGIYGTPSLRVK